MGCNKAITQSEYDSMVEEKDQKIEELEAQNEEKDQQIAEFETQINQMRDHIQTLESRTQEVNAQFERFQHENWRNVVPDAASSLENLNSEIENDPNYSTY